MENHKVGTACTASKLGGQKDGNEYCSSEIRLPSEAVEGSSLAPTRFPQGEGRSPMGRNDHEHHGSSRGMGSGIQGKFLRDNVGKVLLPAGMTTTSKDRSYKRLRSGTEDLGLAHEAVVARIEG